MRARLSAISNYTTSQLLIIIQNWTRDTSEIIVDGQVLTVTSVYFLSNDITPVPTSTSPSQTSINNSNTQNKVILFSAIGSGVGFSLFVCICCIIISVCIFQKCKARKSYKLKPRFVANIISNNVDVIIIYTEYMKCKEEKMTLMIITICQQKKIIIMSKPLYMIR